MLKLMYPKVYIYPLLKAKASNFSVNFCNKGLPEFSERRHTALNLPFETERMATIGEIKYRKPGRLCLSVARPTQVNFCTSLPSFCSIVSLGCSVCTFVYCSKKVITAKTLWYRSLEQKQAIFFVVDKFSPTAPIAYIGISYTCQK